MKALNPYDKMMLSRSALEYKDDTHFDLDKSFIKLTEYKLIENWTIYCFRRWNEFIFSSNGKTKVWVIKSDTLALYNIEDLYKLSLKYLWLNV